MAFLRGGIHFAIISCPRAFNCFLDHRKRFDLTPTSCHGMTAAAYCMYHVITTIFNSDENLVVETVQGFFNTKSPILTDI